VSTAKPADTDLSGKILVVIGQRREFEPVAYARRNNAVALVRLATGTQESWIQFQQQMARFRGFSRGMRPDTGERKFPAAELSPDAAAKVLEGAPVTQDTPTPLGKTLSLSVLGQVESGKTQNVVAIWPGTDPTLKEEYIALGAHYDHIGVGRPNAQGDAINNGADDDGSGTVSLLAMCEALARNKVKLKRSLIFVWHCGEEKGLWGSEYFTNKPTVPIDKIIAQLNIDMIGRSKQSGDTNPRNANLSGPNTIYVIGSRKLSTQLGDLVDGVNGNFLQIEFDYRYDDPADPNRFYFRSDHYNYARKGIPIAFWFDGVHEDYHRVSDEVSKIDFTKIEKVARTVFVTASVLADAPARPKVDKPIE
jgi:Zn-dependent M28 family amino/carboxypeptidase